MMTFTPSASDVNYSKHTWADSASGNTPITASKLNEIETGLDALKTQLNNSLDDDGTLADMIDGIAEDVEELGETVSLIPYSSHSSAFTANPSLTAFNQLAWDIVANGQYVEFTITGQAPNALPASENYDYKLGTITDSDLLPHTDYIIKHTYSGATIGVVYLAKSTGEVFYRQLVGNLPKYYGIRATLFYLHQ